MTLNCHCRIKEWLASSGVKTLYIEPGSPWENAYSETFVSQLRDELLNREVFINLKEARVLLEDYRGHYNHERPHGALGYMDPAEFAAAEVQQGQSSGPAEQLDSAQRLSSWVVRRVGPGQRGLGQGGVS